MDVYILDLYIINRTRLNVHVLRETCNHFLQLKAAVISDKLFHFLWYSSFRMCQQLLD